VVVAVIRNGGDLFQGDACLTSLMDRFDMDAEAKSRLFLLAVYNNNGEEGRADRW
jgi:hypothetical protein